MPMINIKVAQNIFILQLSNIITQIYVVNSIKISIIQPSKLLEYKKNSMSL